MLRCKVLFPLVAAALLAPGVARADELSTIHSFGDHTPYIFEAEPHFLLGYGGPFEDGANAGVGFRGTVHLVDGFIPNIDDSVGIGFGFDLATDGHVLVPLVLQWNFWLSTHWSVFAEPGLAIGSGTDTVLWPAFYAGARVLITNRIGITFRVGWPDLSVGVSFLL
jgi:hypothetical protein